MRSFRILIIIFANVKYFVTNEIFDSQKVNLVDNFKSELFLI